MSRPVENQIAMTPAQAVGLGLRVLLEAGVIGAFAYWGGHIGGGTTSSVLLALTVPAIGFGIWGAVDFRFAGRYAEPLRLAEELAISGLAAAALYVTGQPLLGVVLAALSVSYHAWVYATGERLL